MKRKRNQKKIYIYYRNTHIYERKRKKAATTNMIEQKININSHFYKLSVFDIIVKSKLYIIIVGFENENEPS